MKSKRILAAILATMMSLVSFTSCANSYQSESKASESTVASSQSTAESSEAASGDVETLSMMYNGTETDGAYPYYKQFVEDFNATNDMGVKFDIEFYENEQYKTKLATLMASNSVPDLFFTWELDYLRPFVEGGKVYDITEMANADAALKDSFQEGVLEPLTYDGKLYALPTQICFTVMYYNKAIFAANNISVPTTWEEFEAACATLKANDVTPLVVQASDAWIPAQFVQQMVGGLEGLSVYNGLLDGSVKWNNPTHVEAGQYLQKLTSAEYMQPGFLGMKQEEGRKIFMGGNAAMYFMGSWEISTLLSDGSSVADDVGAFVLPAIKPEHNNIVVGSVDSSLAISASSANPEASFAMIKHWVSKESQETMLYDIGRIPAIKLDIDRSRVSGLMAECLDISDNLVGMNPWLDRAFGAGEGVEFNNTVLAVCGGEDPQTSFDNLQRYVDDTVSR